MATLFVILSLLTGTSGSGPLPTCEAEPSYVPSPVIQRPATVQIGSTPHHTATMGTITGVVTDAATGRFLESAQVFLPGLNRGEQRRNNGIGTPPHREPASFMQAVRPLRLFQSASENPVWQTTDPQVQCRRSG